MPLCKRSPPQEKPDWPPMSSVIKPLRSLTDKGDIKPTRTAGLLFRDKADVSYLNELDKNLNEALHTGEGATDTAFRIVDDALGGGLKWVIFEDDDLADLTSSVYTAGNAISANGAKGRIICTVFPLSFTHSVRQGDTRNFLRTYLIYRYDRQAYYPFVPTGDKEGDRDRPSEVQLAKELNGVGVAIDQSLENWRGIWGMPL